MTAHAKRKEHLKKEMRKTIQARGLLTVKNGRDLVAKRDQKEREDAIRKEVRKQKAADTRRQNKIRKDEATRMRIAQRTLECTPTRSI